MCVYVCGQKHGILNSGMVVVMVTEKEKKEDGKEKEKEKERFCQQKLSGDK